MDSLGLQEFYVERLQANWLPQEKQCRLHAVAVGLAVGLAGGLTYGLAAGLVVGLVGGLGWGLAVGLAWGLAVGLVWGLAWGREAYHSKIRLAETLYWSWPSATQLLVLLIWGLVAGLVVGLAWGLAGGLARGLVVGLAFGLAAGLAGGLKSAEIAQRARPNQGSYRSWQTAKRATLAGGLAVGLVVGLAGGLAGGPLVGLTFGLIFGLAFGLTRGLHFGFNAVINHILLRRALARHNYLPYDLVPYLDHMARLILLRRIGGSYRFIHRTMQEHIAGLTEAEISFVVAGAPLHNPQPNR